MSFADKFESPDLVASADPRTSWRSQATRALLALALLLVESALVYFGHPFIAIWIALAALGWLFLVGAARVSRD